MRSQPFFSIITPTYNRGEFILETISKMLDQSFQDYEIIIVDDGSVDDTPDIVSKIKSPKLSYFQIENSERGAARNYGASKANGKYLNFFDSDDIMYSNHLENAFSFIKEKAFPNIIHTGFEIIREDNTILSKKTNFNYDIKKRLFKTNFFSCNSVFVKKQCFDENPFNEARELASAEDWEIWLRYASRFEIFSSDTITSAVRYHPLRSLFNLDADTIIKRDHALIRYLLADKHFSRFYNKKIPLFIANRLTFSALALSFERRKKEALNCLLKALRSDLYVLGTRRFWASIKRIVVP